MGMAEEWLGIDLEFESAGWNNEMVARPPASSGKVPEPLFLSQDRRREEA